jgi:hypothetical protein
MSRSIGISPPVVLGVDYLGNICRIDLDTKARIIVNIVARNCDSFCIDYVLVDVYSRVTIIENIIVRDYNVRPFDVYAKARIIAQVIVADL